MVLDADLRVPPADAVLMAETPIARGVAAGDVTFMIAGAVPAGVDQHAPLKAPIMGAMAAEAQAGTPMTRWVSISRATVLRCRIRRAMRVGGMTKSFCLPTPAAGRVRSARSIMRLSMMNWPIGRGL